MTGKGANAMLHSAMQCARSHTERLLAISPLFLSAVPAATAPAPEAMHLPVLLAVSSDAPVSPEPGYLLRALARQLNLPGSAVGQDWDLQVYPSVSALPSAAMTLLLVDAELEATRDAFTLIKQLHARGVGRIGVLYRAGEDLGAARRCYRRLAVGAARFLSQPLINLGWLPNPGPHFAAALAHAAQVVHSQRRAPHSLEAAR
jgi:hypothetical protein